MTPSKVSRPLFPGHEEMFLLLSCALIPSGSAAAKYKELQPCTSFRADEIRARSGRSMPHTLGRRGACTIQPIRSD